MLPYYCLGRYAKIPYALRPWSRLKKHFHGAPYWLSTVDQFYFEVGELPGKFGVSYDLIKKLLLALSAILCSQPTSVSHLSAMANSLFFLILSSDGGPTGTCDSSSCRRLDTRRAYRVRNEHEKVA